jgi:hypothetical protein
MVVTASSTPGALQRRPLRRRNTTMVTKAHRLFPSGSAWLLTRCQQRTAALSIRSGYVS